MPLNQNTNDNYTARVISSRFIRFSRYNYVLFIYFIIFIYFHQYKGIVVRIASILRKAILSGEFQEVEELSLTSVAETLSVSRTPVWEAFQVLASENLLILRMNKGAIVKGITVKTIREHFEMRKLPEGKAASQTALKHMDISELLESHSHILSLGNQFTADEYFITRSFTLLSGWQQITAKCIRSCPLSGMTVP